MIDLNQKCGVTEIDIDIRGCEEHEFDSLHTAVTPMLKVQSLENYGIKDLYKWQMLSSEAQLPVIHSSDNSWVISLHLIL